MNLEYISQFFTYFLFACLGMWFLSPLLKDFFNSHFGTNKGKQNIDMDHLIRTQENILRRSEKDIGSDLNNTNYSSLIEKLIERGEAGDQSLVEMIKAFQWGDGPEFRSLNQEIKKHFETNFEPAEINSILKSTFSDLIKLKITPSSKDIFNLLKLSILIKAIIKGKVKKLKASEASSKIYKKAGLCLLNEIFESNTKIELENSYFEDLTKKYSNSNITSLLIDNKTELKDFISHYREKTELFSSLTPIEPLNHKKDIERAFKILNLQKSSSIDDIKKEYKRLASKKHPDKFRPYKFSKEVEDIIAQNFLIIKESYEMVLASKEKNKG
jgi:hypothetical protein